MSKINFDEYENIDEVYSAEWWSPYNSCFDDFECLARGLGTLIPELQDMKIKDVVSKIRNMSKRELLSYMAISAANDSEPPIIYKWDSHQSKLVLFDATGDGICRIHCDTYVTTDEKLAEWILKFNEDSIEVEFHELDEDFELPDEGYCDDLCKQQAEHVKVKNGKVSYDQIDLDLIYHAIGDYGYQNELWNEIINSIDEEEA